MTVTVASFRADFPQEFGSLALFPNQAVAYWLAMANLLLNVNYWGVGAVVATSPPTAMYDFATELWVAHQLVVEAQAVKAGAGGGIPGGTSGILASKSVGSVSAGYDVASIMELEGGYYNSSIYGRRFIRMARLFGAGPVQIGIGFNPMPFAAFQGFEFAWGGPYPGISPSDVGFG